MEAGLPLEPPFHEATVGAWPWSEQPLPEGRRLWVWDLAASTCVRRIGGHTAPVIGASLSAEGAIAAALDLAGNIRCFSVGDGFELGCWALKSATHVALDGRARFALLGTTAGALHRLDLETGALTELVSRGPGGDPVRSLALSADGRHAAWSTSSAVRLWDAERGRLRGYLSRQDLSTDAWARS